MAGRPLRWSATISGQPPTWNHMYTIGWAFRGRRSFPTLVKKQNVVKYQDDARKILATARPSRWHPDGMIRVYYLFFLERDVDCDNILKALNDALAGATGIDDKRFLPCVIWKTSGVSRKEARVELVVEGPVSPSVDPPTWTSTPTS